MNLVMFIMRIGRLILTEGYTEITKQIWTGILESERLYRYYHSLSDKFDKHQ